VAVKIKLKRMGKIRAPYYRIVVADSRTKRDGRAIEEIGKYHPKADPSFIEVVSDRAQYWLSVGAQPTEPVRRILEITGDWQRFRGEPGAEGTLRTAPAKVGKGERFAEAVGQKPADTPAKTARAGAAKTEAAKADTAKGDTGKADTGKADTGKADTAKGRSGRRKAAEAEPADSADSAGPPSDG
jgi:small subunit ribosomal protein S16